MSLERVKTPVLHSFEFMKAFKWIIGLVALYFFGFSLIYLVQEENALAHPMVVGSMESSVAWGKGLQSWAEMQVRAFQKKKSGLDKIVIPKQDGNIPLGLTIPNHWVRGESRFVYVAFEDTILYAQPREDSLVLRTLIVSERVRVGYIDPTGVLTKGRQTKWAFLISPDGKTPLGWVLDFQLGYQNRFRPVIAWSWDTFEFCKGEYCATYSVTVDGQFDMHWKATDGALALEGRDKGRMCQYGEIYWAKKASYEDALDVFKMGEGNKLMQEHLYDKNPIKEALF